MAMRGGNGAEESSRTEQLEKMANEWTTTTDGKVDFLAGAKAADALPTERELKLVEVLEITAEKYCVKNCNNGSDHGPCGQGGRHMSICISASEALTAHEASLGKGGKK